MLVFHLPISRFLSYGITPRPMAGPVGRCDGMLQFTGRTSRNRSCPRGWCMSGGGFALSGGLGRFYTTAREIDPRKRFVADSPRPPGARRAIVEACAAGVVRLPAPF